MLACNSSAQGWGGGGGWEMGDVGVGVETSRSLEHVGTVSLLCLVSFRPVRDPVPTKQHNTKQSKMVDAF